jgi:hypothetical protein
MDAERTVIEPLVPADVRGKEGVDAQRVRNGIF